jgi:serine/threonine protein kinase
LAAGLAAAHDRGILHRDLKPANVMLDGNGDVRILDFGIAAALGDRELLSLLAGTPGFVAPELLAGQPPSVQSDLYAWGLVMYFAACGELPRGEAGAAEDLLDSCEIGDKLSDKIRACLNSNPALRPRSAHELVVALSARDPLRAAIEAGNVPPPALLLASRSWQPAPRLLDRGLFRVLPRLAASRRRSALRHGAARLHAESIRTGPILVLRSARPGAGSPRNPPSTATGARSFIFTECLP